MTRFNPSGVVVAGLGRRFLAAMIDLAPPVAVFAGAILVLRVASQPSVTLTLVTFIAAVVLVGAYGLHQWWAYGTRAAGLGAGAVGLRVVGVDDGLPVGWGRWFIRQLVLLVLAATTVVGGIALVVFLVAHERRRGWHDLAAGAIVVQQRPGEQPDPGHTGAADPVRPETDDVVPAVSPPEWLPRLETHPLQPVGQRDPATPQSPPPVHEPPPRPTPARPVNQGWIPLPTPSSVIEPVAPKVRPRDFGGSAGDGDGTRITAPAAAGPRRGDEGWYVRLDDGREVELSVTVLLGRNPQKSEGDPDVHLVPAGGDGRMISRTHVLLGTDARGVFVVDRGSTNGTALVTGEGELEPCPVGTQVRVRLGQQVSYGNRWFTVLRRPEAS